MWYLIFLIAMLIYFDSVRSGIYKVRGGKEFWNNSPTGWFWCVLWIGIVAVPVYLKNRKKMIERCKKRFEGKTTTWWVVVFNIFLGMFVYFIVLGNVWY